MSILDEPMFPQLWNPLEWEPAGAATIADPDTAKWKLKQSAPGKSARVYAAIHLCVPESGDEELDAMIRKAQRVRVAEAVVGTMIHMSTTGDGGWDISTVVAGACNLADAMLAEREKKP